MYSSFDKEIDGNMDQESLVVNVDPSSKDLLGINPNDEC